MPLKVYLLELKDKESPLEQKRRIEHLLVKYSGVRISLKDAVNSMNIVATGKAAEVLFNSDKITEIENAFFKYAVLVSAKATG